MFKSATITKHINTTATKAFIIYDVILVSIGDDRYHSPQLWDCGSTQPSSAQSPMTRNSKVVRGRRLAINQLTHTLW